MGAWQSGDAAVLGGLIIISVTLVRLVERLVDSILLRRNGKKSVAPAPAGGCRGLTEQEHAALMRLDEMHCKYDRDGTPLWYVPRSLERTLEEISKTLDRTAVRLRDIVKTQELLSKRLDRWEDTTANIAVGRK